MASGLTCMPPGETKAVRSGFRQTFASTGSAAQARRKAAETIARIKSGEDPEGKPASTVTVADVAARYLREHVALHCKPGTAKLYRRRGETLHPACLRPRWRRRGRARAHRRTALRARRYALSGEPGAGDRKQAVQPRRVVEASHGQQPMQVRAQVPGEEARTVPYRRGVPPSRRRPERDGDGQELAGCTRRRRFAF